MQTLTWYYKRLKAMSPDEIIWRIKSLLRDKVDRLFVTRRQQLRNLSEILDGDLNETESGFRVSDMPLGHWAKLAEGDIEKNWYQSLISRADKIVDHKLSFFDLEDEHLGDPIVWNRDHKRKQDTPMTYCSSLDYRDVDEAGDCKFVWEPNRHHQLVILGRAYKASGNIKYADAIAEQLNSWLDQNPFGFGMNWRSGLELGIRMINWVWALDMIKESGAVDDKLQHRIIDSVSRHAWEIDRKYSQGSSVNNHLIGEAAGVYVAAGYFTNLKHADKWRKKSKEILVREIINQTFPDGGSPEQAIGYHLFVLQFFVAATIIGDSIGDSFPESFWSRLEKMFEFMGTLSQGGENLPAYGDGDDGYVLDIGDEPRNIKQWLAVGAVLFKRSDLKALAGEFSEPAEWLFGEKGRKVFNEITELPNKAITSTAFKDSGYYLLQHGELDSSDRISVVFDCGPLGMGSLAAHGHADALSFTLRAFGKDILIDPGTYDYFTYPKWRQYFRGTAAHNTIVVDGKNQSEMQGLFLWGSRANAHCIDWQPTEFGGKVSGEHDGYSNMTDSVTHIRCVELNGSEREIVVRDQIKGRGKHEIEVYYHLAEHCQLKSIDGNRILVDAGQGTVTIELDPNLKVEVVKGSENPICGWVSRGYHSKQDSTTLVGRRGVDGDASLVCRFEIGQI